jgi:glycerol-3-phosphate dehydrogenase
LNFSYSNRETFIKQLSATTFDLLVIGGGITGAGIALDATSRGLKVALIDMQDFAGGTSGRSTKLIHGGLRYLKQLELKLVSEVGKEREIIHYIAPHLTKPETMLLPIVKQGSLGKLSSRIGMWIYEILAGVKRKEKHRNLSVEDTLTEEPLLKKDGLLGGILFYEYRTDDSRLTLEIIKEAVSRGAVAVNYIKAISFDQNKNRISGAMVKDELNGKEFEIKAKYFVNAAGPWVEQIASLDEKKIDLKLSVTKGVHIVVDHKKLPVKHALYFDTLDKRMIFVIPREGRTYIGTTDTFYRGDLKHPNITPEDITYLLNSVNNYFPSSSISEENIISSWAGIRPLISKPGKKPSEISRKDEQFTSAAGLITIAGGKLTGYRKMAQRVVDQIAETIRKTEGRNLPECSTDRIRISGGKTDASHTFEEFIKVKGEEGSGIGLTVPQAELLAKRYGSNIDAVYTIVGELVNEKNDLPLFLRAQIRYTIEHEMCVSPCDFFMRRTGMMYFAPEIINQYKTVIVNYMRELLSWDYELASKFESELEGECQAIRI